MTNTNFVSDYLGGRVPLVRVFWLYGVLGGVLLGIFMGLAKGSALYQLLAFVLLAYLLSWYVALWRSATNYEGMPIWKLLARGLVVLPVLGIVASVALPTMQKEKQTTPVVQPAYQSPASPAVMVITDAETGEKITVDPATIPGARFDPKTGQYLFK